MYKKIYKQVQIVSSDVHVYIMRPKHIIGYAIFFTKKSLKANVSHFSCFHLNTFANYLPNLKLNDLLLKQDLPTSVIGVFKKFQEGKHR